jgi:hypothetical protein
MLCCALGPARWWRPRALIEVLSSSDACDCFTSTFLECPAFSIARSELQVLPGSAVKEQLDSAAHDRRERFDLFFGWLNGSRSAAGVR